MEFKRITRVDLSGLIIRGNEQLTRFVQALGRIDNKPYHDKVPDSEEDSKSISRQVSYEPPNRLYAEQFDIRFHGRRSYFEEF